MAGSQELEDQRKAFAERLAHDQQNVAPRYTDLDDLPMFHPVGRTIMGGTERLGLVVVLLIIAIVVIAEFLGVRDLLMMVVHLVRRWAA